MDKDSLDRVAQALASDGGCCGIVDDDGRCCMTDRAIEVMHVVLSEIDRFGLGAGADTGVLRLFADAHGLTFEHVKPEDFYRSDP